MHGRLRARPGALGPRRDPAGLQRQAPGPGHGALRADHGGRRPAGALDGGRARQPRDQRPRGVHPRQRVHPRRVRGRRVLRRGRILRARHRGRRRHRTADGDMDRGRPAGARPLEDGHPAVRGGVPLAVVHARALHRELRDVLRHPLSQRGAAVRATAADVARPTRSWLAWVRRSARSPAGSVRTGSSRMRRPATPGSARGAGPASTGRPRSGPRRSRHGRQPASSTSRRSPSSR